MNIEKLKQDYPDIVWAGKKNILGLPISFTTYILTETKLITCAGFLSLTEDEIELYRIRDLSLQLPLIQRLFQCGTIKVTAVDSDTSIKYLYSVKNPRQVKALLNKHMDIQYNKYHVRGRDMYGASNLTHDDCLF